MIISAPSASIPDKITPVKLEHKQECEQYRRELRSVAISSQDALDNIMWKLPLLEEAIDLSVSAELNHEKRCERLFLVLRALEREIREVYDEYYPKFEFTREANSRQRNQGVWGQCGLSGQTPHQPHST